MTLLQYIVGYLGTVVVATVVVGGASGFTCDPAYALGAGIIWPIALIRSACKWVGIYWKGSR